MKKVINISKTNMKYDSDEIYISNPLSSFSSPLSSKEESNKFWVIANFLYFFSIFNCAL